MSIRIIFETEDAYDYAIAEAKAAAWDEGYTIGNRHDGRRDANPYRERKAPRD